MKIRPISETHLLSSVNAMLRKLVLPFILVTMVIIIYIIMYHFLDDGMLCSIMTGLLIVSIAPLMFDRQVGPPRM
ncbi:hypothetical protein Q4F19_07345 [Sphingomonas sp. BIUV-7]|uniref:Uncharacterized protein n=1 Tax=Sphingomonas natans TaxID=3063330 RepID=A0ABT8Y871_9SPHN|nr:hypothetical protein [Sphingomonas sp. BIUV-7]MDO6414192.1 hypothetical protein [Sphingomonas sp. BIUV-7]